MTNAQDIVASLTETEINAIAVNETTGGYDDDWYTPELSEAVGDICRGIFWDRATTYAIAVNGAA